ncbi:nucleotidyltransferase [Tundrisphaera sp. TA3]|uniref:nucleotidyltransferase n=1 Tax=Tundrisphaera sp. TA3 TaxID=3435775 RepID=UPI003EC0F675
MQPAHLDLDPRTREFYVRTMTVLAEAGVPFLVGGAFALAAYTEIERHTKDVDFFLKRSDLDPALEALSRAGYRTEIPFPHWLAKAHGEDCFADLIFNSGNGVARVDDGWFRHATEAQVLGIPVRVCPPEEMIWSKCYVQERERYDGADIAHLILARGDSFDWRRLLDRFGDHWRLILSQLILFGFCYPSERGKVPAWVLRELTGRLEAEVDAPAPAEKVCLGTFLSREQYQADTGLRGYADARVRPAGPMSAEEVAHWTACIEPHK